MPTNSPTPGFSAARAVCLLLVLATVCCGGCKKKVEDAPEVAVAVQAQHPSTGPISEEITADATLSPLAQAALSPRISSPIRAEYVQRGTHVRRGQLLVTLEDRDLEGAVLDSKGGVAAAEAAYTTATEATIPEDVQRAQLDVTQTKALLDVANRTALDRKRLFQQGALPGRDADTASAAALQAQAAYETAVKHLEAVERTTREADRKTAAGQLTSAKGKLISAEAQIGYASLRSPIDGVVTDRPLFPGETATAGSPVMTIMDTSSLLAKLHLAQSSAQQLKLGSEAEISVPGVDVPITAVVSLISPALDPGSTTVEIWLKLPNPGARFKVGTPVHVVIHGRTAVQALQVPAGAVLPANDGSTTVMAVGADGVARVRAVKLGLRTPESVEVTSGLSAADLVITQGSYGLDDGTKVTVGSQKAAAEDKD